MPFVPKPLVKRIAFRYVAGERLVEAVEEVKTLNSDGMLATMDLLGEHCQSKDQALQTAETYFDILDAIEKENLNSNISVKPTALGLKLGYDFCKGLLHKIVSRATELHNFVRIDMEDVSCTDDTLRLYFELRKEFEGVGVVIQTYLRRTIKDLDWLKSMSANLRICKGIYNEPRIAAYKNRNIIIDNYALLLEEALTAGCYVGIATHCEEVVWRALNLIRKLGLSKDQYEFQMLFGVDPELQQILQNDGHRLRIYVPYGKEWFPYASRRLKENPAIAGSVAREFIGLSRAGY